MRVHQPQGTRGSLKWIKRATNEKWDTLELPILEKIRGATAIDWRSPRENDHFAEYRDADFLTLLGKPTLVGALRKFWPPRGPQWDGLGLTDNGALLLVEAKAHVAELCSPGSGASPKSRAWIKNDFTKWQRNLTRDRIEPNGVTHTISLRIELHIFTLCAKMTLQRG